MPRQSKPSKSVKESNEITEQAPVEQTPPVEQKTKTKTKRTQPVPPVETTPVVEAPAKRKQRKASVTEDPTPSSVTEEPTPSPVTEDPVSEKRRRDVTRETVERDFDDLLRMLSEETQHIQSTEGKNSSVSVKLLRQLVKRVKSLKSDTQRVSKQRTRSSRPVNTSSGFMKPVKISKEMSKFVGWNPEELKSRVSITKALCQYIKDNDLQNPEDRRQIVPDSKLAKLLNYDQKVDGKPLTYYYLQQKIQPHFSS